MAKQNNKGKGKGKATNCENFIPAPKDVFTTLWQTQEKISVYDLIVYVINNNAYAGWRWNGDRQRKDWSLHIMNLPCLNIETNQYFDYESFIYRIELYNSSDEVVFRGCFNPVCNVSSIDTPDLVEGEIYRVKFTDFPEADELTFKAEYY